MNLLFVGPTAGLSGVDQTMRMLCAGLQQRGHSVTAVLPSKAPIANDLLQSEVSVIESPLLSWWFNPAFFDDYIPQTIKRSKPSIDHLCTLIHNIDPDVVISNTSVFMDALLAAKICGKPHVTHMHSLFVENVYKTMSPTFKSSVYRLLGSEGCSIVTPTRAIADKLVGAYGIPTGNVHLVRNGIDVDHFRAEQRIAGAATSVLSLGDFNTNKNQAFLVGVAKKLKQLGRSDIVFTLVGPSEEAYLRGLNSAIAREDVCEYFTILPQTGHVLKLLQSADIYVNSSKTESFPVSLLEAMAASLPIVCTPTLGAKEILADDETGFIAGDVDAFCEAIRKLADSPALRQSMGDAARRRVVEHFSLDRFLGGFEEALRTAQKPLQTEPWLQAVFLRSGVEQTPRPPYRVAVLVPDRGQTSFELLIQKPFDHFVAAHSGFEFKVFDLSNIDSASLAGFDMLYVLRTFSDKVAALVEQANAAAMPIVFETDDNYFALHFPDGNPVHELHQNAALENIIALATRVIVYSEPMLAAVQPINPAVSRLAPFQVFPDSLPEPSSQPVVGFMGSLKKDVDFDMVVPALLQLLEERSDLRLEFFGFIPVELQDNPRVLARAFNSNYDEFLHEFRKRKWMVGIAPLADTEFNRSKTNNKYREYAAAAYAGVYSNVGPYAESVTDGETGLLVENQPEAWYQAMNRLLDDEALRRKIATSAYFDVAENFAFDAHAEKKWEIIQQTKAEATRLRPKVPVVINYICRWYPEREPLSFRPCVIDLTNRPYASVVIDAKAGDLHEVNVVLRDFIRSSDTCIGVELIHRGAIIVHELVSVLTAERDAVTKIPLPRKMSVDGLVEVRIFAQSPLGKITVLGRRSLVTGERAPIVGLVFGEA